MSRKFAALTRRVATMRCPDDPVRLAPLGWTAARILRLRQLWADHLSCAAIASALGGVTRDAVSGKARRLGLSERGAVPFDRARRTTARRSRVLRARVLMRPMALLANEARELPREPREIPVVQRRTLLQLTSDSCRWPIGDPCAPEFYFCGASALDGLPYCAAHARRAYRRTRGPPGPAPQAR